MHYSELLGGVFLFLLVSSTGEAKTCDESAEALLGKAIDHFGDHEYSKALWRLREAEPCTSDETTLAEIQRQLGLVQDAMDQPAEALVSFLRALSHDASITLERGAQVDSANVLFDCAVQLGSQILGDPASIDKARKAARAKPFVCPARTALAAPTLPASKPGGPKFIEGEGASAKLRPTERPADTVRWGWVAAGTATLVVGLAVNFVIISGSRSKEAGRLVLDGAAIVPYAAGGSMMAYGIWPAF